MDGRLYVRANDIAEIALPVLRHRIVPSYRALADGISASEIARRVLEIVKVPDAPRVERKVA